MSERILEIVSGDRKRFFNSSLEEIVSFDARAATTVPDILGVWDFDFGVPDVGQRVKLPGIHKGFYVARLPDTQPIGAKLVYDDDEEPIESTYSNPLYFNFEIVGPEGVTIKKTVRHATEDYEGYDTYESVEALIYLGVGVLGFVTSMSIDWYFGPKFEHKGSRDLGYYRNKVNMTYLRKNPTAHIKSFEALVGKYIIINEVDHTTKKVEDSLNFLSRFYPLYRVDEHLKCIGFMNEELSYQTIDSKLGDFDSFKPLLMDNKVYILRPSQDKINMYEIQKIGTPEEKLAKVKEIEVPNANTTINLLQL